MSTYYYLLCNDCKEKTDAASRTTSGYCHLSQSEWTLTPFIISHSGHNTKIVSEHDYELYDSIYEYKEWNKENVTEMIALARERGDWVK